MEQRTDAQEEEEEREQTDREAGRDRNTETESVKHRHAVSGGVSRSVKRTWLRGRGRGRGRSGEDVSCSAIYRLSALLLCQCRKKQYNRARRRGEVGVGRTDWDINWKQRRKEDGRNRVLAVAARGVEDMKEEQSCVDTEPKFRDQICA